MRTISQYFDCEKPKKRLELRRGKRQCEPLKRQCDRDARRSWIRAIQTLRNDRSCVYVSCMFWITPTERAHVLTKLGRENLDLVHGTDVSHQYTDMINAKAKWGRLTFSRYNARSASIISQPHLRVVIDRVSNRGHRSHPHVHFFVT